jgi:hypothetical protein
VQPIPLICHRRLRALRSSPALHLALVTETRGSARIVHVDTAWAEGVLRTVELKIG